MASQDILIIFQVNKNNMRTELIEKFINAQDYIEARKQSVSVALKSEELKFLIQALSEPKGVSAEVVFDGLITSDFYACTRVWDAWNVGTMTQDDFIPLNECDEFKEDFIQAMHDYAGQSDAIRFLDSIRDYEHEAGKQICYDERTSEELYQQFLNREEGKKCYAI